MMKTINKIREITGQVSQKYVGAYAAQSAYFFVLSMIPIILLLLFSSSFRCAMSFLVASMLSCSFFSFGR